MNRQNQGSASRLFYVLDGRHRHAAAVKLGLTELPCTFLDENEKPTLMTVPVSAILPDPFVQLTHTFVEKRADRYAANWDPAKVQALTVIARDSKMAGVRRAEIKMGIDRERRSVRPLEHFFMREIAGEQAVLDLVKVTKDYGYKFGPLRNDRPYTTIGDTSSVETLVNLQDVGLDGWAAILELNQIWLGQPGTNRPRWLFGLGRVVRDYDYTLAEPVVTTLGKLSPGEIYRDVSGEVALGAYGARLDNGIKNLNAPFAVGVASKIVANNRGTLRRGFRLK